MLPEDIITPRKNVDRVALFYACYGGVFCIAGCAIAFLLAKRWQIPGVCIGICGALMIVRAVSLRRMFRTKEWRKIDGLIELNERLKAGSISQKEFESEILRMTAGKEGR